MIDHFKCIINLFNLNFSFLVIIYYGGKLSFISTTTPTNYLYVNFVMYSTVDFIYFLFKGKNKTDFNALGKAQQDNII